MDAPRRRCPFGEPSFSDRSLGWLQRIFGPPEGPGPQHPYSATRPSGPRDDGDPDREAAERARRADCAQRMICATCGESMQPDRRRRYADKGWVRCPACGWLAQRRITTDEAVTILIREIRERTEKP